LTIILTFFVIKPNNYYRDLDLDLDLNLDLEEEGMSKD